MNAEQISQTLNLPISQDFFDSIPEASRRYLILSAQTRAELVQSWNEPITNKVLLKQTLKTAKLYMDSKVYAEMEEQDSFELWTPPPAFEFMGSCQTLFHLTSWSVNDLLTKPWSELFIREDEATSAIIGAILECQKTNKIMRNVMSPHVVVERKDDPVAVVASVKMIAHLENENGKLAGFVGITTLKPLKLQNSFVN